MRRRSPPRPNPRFSRKRRDRPEPPPGGPSPRVLGHVELLRGQLWFLPAGRMRRARRPLAPMAMASSAPEVGDYVVAECPWNEDRAHVVEVLGREDDPRWDNQAVLSQHRWPTRFSRGALEEARQAR